jgi:hypothetical protein
MSFIHQHIPDPMNLGGIPDPVKLDGDLANSRRQVRRLQL